jgi:ectoine hydroxylase-related dioxygenase (phytanoyl-CoA dioxygenase family)
MKPAEWIKGALEKNGFAIVGQLVDPDTLTALRKETDLLISRSSARAGVRAMLDRSAALEEFAIGPPAAVAVSLLGSEARPTKLTIFDKSGSTNWKVPWHQDLTIIVKQRRDVPGYGCWTVKDGLPHVQPPVGVLEQVLAVRVHLDDTPPENGALRVIPGTHAMGRLPAERIAELRRERKEVVCPVPAGGAMFMKPLLLHASSPASSPTRRRVLHFEYSALRLPENLAWAWPSGAPDDSL